MTTASTLPAEAADCMIDVRSVAAMLGCSWRSELRHACAGLMPSGVKIGALRRWRKSELQDWIASGCKPVRPLGGIMFDATRWAELIAREVPQGRRLAPSPKARRPLSRMEVLQLIRAELEALRKDFEDRLYRDLEEAIPAHIKHELRIKGGEIEEDESPYAA